MGVIITHVIHTMEKEEYWVTLNLEKKTFLTVRNSANIWP